MKILKILKNKNLVIEIPLLKSLSKDYQLSYSKKLVSSLKKFKKINLIGMGGSILGTQAIYDFLKDKITKKINFFDNLQSREFNTNKEKNINIIVSKSGNTLETITNHNLISLKEKKNKNLFITETKDSFLTQLANKLKAEIIEHKNFIGGRYSVLSEVGMLPAELMGLKEKRFKNFNNLIKNAIEAVEKIPNPAVEVLMATEAKNIKIEIKDNGVGIDEKMLSKIFEPYFTTKTKGTGLGLSIVKRIIEDHGGKIKIEKNKNMAGTTSLINFEYNA